MESSNLIVTVVSVTNGVTTTYQVHSLEELFDYCQKFDPDVYVTIDWEKTGSYGSDFISMTLDD